MTPETLKRIEWCILDARDMPRQCPVCYSVREKGHAPGCELKADLDASSGERPEDICTECGVTRAEACRQIEAGENDGFAHVWRRGGTS